MDEPVWLTPEDVAVGKDTVVAAALDWISHVTASGGGFKTRITIANGSNQEERVVAPYDSAGNALTQVGLFIPGKGTTSNLSTDLFGEEPVSHFSVCAPAAVIVTAAYSIATDEGAAGHVHETSQAGTHYRIYPGQWDYVFDGMALVNLGAEPTQVRVSLRDYSGEVTETVTLNEALSPQAKQLALFDAVFADADGKIIEVETDQPASVLFLCGTRPGVTPGYLFQNNQVPETAAAETGKKQVARNP